MSHQGAARCRAGWACGRAFCLRGRVVVWCGGGCGRFAVLISFNKDARLMGTKGARRSPLLGPLQPPAPLQHTRTQYYYHALGLEDARDGHEVPRRDAGADRHQPRAEDVGALEDGLGGVAVDNHLAAALSGFFVFVREVCRCFEARGCVRRSGYCVLSVQCAKMGAKRQSVALVATPGPSTARTAQCVVVRLARPRPRQHDGARHDTVRPRARRGRAEARAQRVGDARRCSALCVGAQRRAQARARERVADRREARAAERGG